MATPQVEHLAPSELHPNPRNSRTHSKKQIRQLGESMDTFGFTNPILIDAQNTVLAGHARLEAAKLRQLKTVPCIRLET